MVERHLAKVDVAGSSPVSLAIFVSPAFIAAAVLPSVEFPMCAPVRRNVSGTLENADFRRRND